ncbi:MAG: hypothetical protein QOC96_1910 [Acidobacteriota bacterium]|jgi:H+/Cl- antiporter ClcA|nr:hypothetical protein [Acidobacteriota bacterium]
MSDKRLVGLLLLAFGLIYALCGDAIGRHNAKLFKSNPRPFQMIAFFGGLLVALIGILVLIIG